LVEVSKIADENLKEFILAFGARVNSSINQSQMMNTSVMPSSLGSMRVYSPIKSNLEISTLDILQARKSHKSKLEDSPILAQNLSKVSSILKKDRDSLDQETFLNSLPIVQETSLADEEHSSQQIIPETMTEETGSLKFDDDDSPFEPNLEKKSETTDSNGSELVEVEVNQVIHDIDKFTSTSEEEMINDENKLIKQISESKNRELESLIAKNEKFQ
jgi:hypothetical protein